VTKYAGIILLAELLGLALIVYGVTLVFVPAAIILCGALLLTIAYLSERPRA